MVSKPREHDMYFVMILFPLLEIIRITELNIYIFYFTVYYNRADTKFSLVSTLRPKINHSLEFESNPQTLLAAATPSIKNICHVFWPFIRDRKK